MHILLEDIKALTNSTLNHGYISLFVVKLNLLHTPRVFQMPYIWGEKTRFNTDGFKWEKSKRDLISIKNWLNDIYFGTDHDIKWNSSYHDFCFTDTIIPRMNILELAVINNTEKNIFFRLILKYSVKASKSTLLKKLCKLLYLKNVKLFL